MSSPGVSGSRYERLLVVGRGGMGEVFLARQLGPEGFQRPVALKRVLPGHGHDPDLRRMFVAEANMMAGLSHPNICQTIELCSLEDELFLVLEYLEGVTVGDLVKEVGALPTNVVGGILIQACGGLEHAHGKGLVHRDLSPSNLLVTGDGLVKILDFGVAKVRGSERSSSGLKGKSPYMSPEHVSGRPIDQRSDLFALGVLGLEALTGSPLFLRESDYLTYQAILEDTRPVRLGPSPLDPILATCLSVDPADRPASARALGQELRAALHAVGGEATQHDLSEYVEHHMADALRAIRERARAALAGGAVGAPAILHTVELRIEPLALAPTVLSPMPPPARGPDEVSQPAGAPPIAGPAGRRSSGRRVGFVLLGLLALGAAFAVGLRAAGDGDSSVSVVDVAPAIPADVRAPFADAGRSPPDAGRSPQDAGRSPPDAGTRSPDAGPRPGGRRPRGSGHVSIDSTPFAVLWIDGKEVGTTPLLRYPLADGVHRVIARTEDGRTRRISVRVRAGKHTATRITFD